AVDLVLRLVALIEEIREDRLVPPYVPIHRFAVRIEKEFRWIAAMSVLRLPRTMHAEAVALPGTDVRPVSVPDETGGFRKIDAGLISGIVEETQLDTAGHFGENGEIRAGAVESCAERIGISGPDLHGRPRQGQTKCPVAGQLGTFLAFIREHETPT